MKNLTKAILAFYLIVSVTKTNAQVTGLVFRDYNGNGTRQSGAGYTEPGAGGVIIRAYNSSDILIATQTSSSATATMGQYAFPATGVNSIANGAAVRLEFIIPSSGTCAVNRTYDFSSGAGTIHGTAVRFLSGGATAININYAINDPNDYLSNAAPFTNTMLFVPRYHSGNATGSGNAANGGVFYKMSYAIKGSTSIPASSLLALNSQIGTCYGVAYSKQADRVFTSAFLKRHNGLGPANGTFNNAPGAIYIINPNLTSSTGAASYFTSLDALGAATHNSTGSPTYATAYSITGLGYGATISYSGTGAGGLGVIGTNAARGLPNDSTTRSTDAGAFGQVGKVSLGDIEISDDGQYLFVTNFYDRKLYQLQLNSVTNPTSATLVNSWSLPNPPLRSTSGLTNASTTYTGSFNGTDFYDGTKGFQRPFAIKYYRGKVYIGAVTTGEGIGASSTVEINTNGVPEYTDLWAYVWEFNPATGTFTSSPTLQTPLNFDRGLNADGQSETWRPWTNTVPTAWSTASTPDYSQYQQPMFSGIEFDADGTMVLGFRDRFGDQSGYDQSGINGSISFAGQAMGDMYRAYYNLSTCAYEMEQSGKEGPGSSKAATLGATSGQGPSNYTSMNGEFYYRDNVYNGNTSANIGTFHLNALTGALVIIKGTDSVAVTAMDPLRAWSSGVSWFGSTGGDNGRDYEMFAGAGAGNFPTPATGAIGKANGLGDIELLSSLAPIEIGNRIWNDTNGDGVQNAGEAGIGDVTLEIFADFNNDGVPDGAALGTTTSAISGDIGSWYFNTANITDGDPSIAGNQAGPAANRRYIVRVATADWTSGAGVGDLLNYRLTGTDITGSGQVDYSDNDASILNNIPSISILTGSNGVNNHNFDFGFKQLGAIGDRVWLDNGVGSGIASDGLQNGTEPGVAGVSVNLFLNSTLVSSTVTDAYGNYFFDNLATGGANIYTVKITPPANYIFSTQTNTTVDAANDATGSDVNITTGITYSFTLNAGEIERDIDAGLVFSQLPTTQSIGNRVWLDNGNGGGTANDGLQNGTEPGVAGVVVSLYFDADNNGTITGAEVTAPYATTITDANGNYLFNSLSVGNYQVGTTLPAGFTYTPIYNAGGGTTGDPLESDADSDIDPATKRTVVLALGSGENLINVDAGLVAAGNTTASIGDFVWNDLDADGVQDAGEPGIAGVTVTLYAADGTTVVSTTTTDAFGGYIFNNLTGGVSYVIGIAPPAGYTVSPQNVGSDITDSDIGTVTFKTAPILLPNGIRNMTVDAGLIKTSPAGTARLGNKVWFDNGIGGGTAGNGLLDGGEPGVSGVTVELLTNAGIAIDPDGAGPLTRTTVTTDADGSYGFTQLAAASYIIAFSNLPAGYTLTQRTGTTDNQVDNNSDVNIVTARTIAIALSAAESDQTIDAGLVAGNPAGKGSLGNKVFYDIANLGIQDAGETGVAGVTVTLQCDLNNDGVFVGAGETGFATQTTNSLGEYLFTGLNAGSYRIVFSNGPAGYNITTANTGTNDAVDSDGDNAGSAISSTTSTTGTINLGVGEDNLTVDLGIVRSSGTTGSISDRVWFDTNADGDRDNATEPGIAGVTVTLYDASGIILAVTTTDANGYYLFNNLAAKTTTTDYYQVGFSNYPVGLVSTSQTVTITNEFSAPDGAGKTQIINLAAGQNRTDIDFGLISTRASLGNFVWIDSDGDGIQDAGEQGVPGVTVLLYFDANADGDFIDAGETTAIASMITDQNGSYLFTNLNYGNYQVEFTTIPSGLNFTTKDQTTGGGNDINDSDVFPATGRTGTVTLTLANNADLTVDAGLYKPTASVGNYIWADNNSNNVQDAGDQGVAGVLVTLYTSAGVPVSTTVTDKNGFYLFTNVAPNSYYVGFSNTPAGALFVIADQGGDDTKDSDVNGTNGTGTTITFTVPQASVNITIDAGLIYTQTLPVKIAFTAQKQNTTSLLTWIVGEADNVLTYVIEHSPDGRNFNELTRVAATNSITNYTKVDAAPYSGINYYRIKVINADGSIKYSEIRIVNFNGAGSINIFPNPATDKINIQLPDSWQGRQVTIDVISQLGQVVQSKQLSQAGQVESIDVSKLSVGIYNIRLTDGNLQKEVRKIQVQ